MAAEAVVDFVGKDDKLDKALTGIKGNVEGLSNKLSGALKIGLGLFSAEKVLSFGKAVLRAAGESDKYKDAWAGVQESVNKFMVALGGPVIEALESMIPVINEIADAISKWGEGFGDKLKEWQRSLAGFLGAITPGVTAEEAQAEFDRQQQDKIKERERRRQERESKDPESIKAQEAEAERIRAKELEFQRQSAEVEADVRRQKERSAMAAAGQRQIGEFLGGKIQDFTKGLAGRDLLGEGIKGLFGKVGEGVGGASNLQYDLGKVIADSVKNVIPEREGFTSTFEDFNTLFKRIAGSAASTPEQKAAEKTAKSTEKTAEFTEKAADAGQGLLDLFKSGGAKIAALYS